MTGADPHQLVSSFVDERRDALVTLCADLVAARSDNPPGRTIEAAAVVQAFLGGYGIECETLAHDDDKPNVVCVLDADDDDSDNGPHLGLNGHLDTITAGDEADWSLPPFTLTREGDRLLGLGIGNMKAGTAALALAAAFLAEHKSLWRGRLSFTAVADETMFGPAGAGWLLSRRPDLLCDALICGEGPGDMALAVAEKGLLWITLEARGEPGQSMLAARGSSAIVRLSQAIAELDAMNDEQVTPPQEIAVVAGTAGDHRQRLTVNVGTVAGGTFFSHAASRARAEIDFRIPPGLTIADIDGRLDEIAACIPDLSHTHVKGWDPNWSAPDAAVARAVGHAAHAVRGAPPARVVRLPASDASRWRARGVPAVCFGPQPLLASGVDDYVVTRDVFDCAKIYALAALSYFADPVNG